MRKSILVLVFSVFLLVGCSPTSTSYDEGVYNVSDFEPGTYNMTVEGETTLKITPVGSTTEMYIGSYTSGTTINMPLNEDSVESFHVIGGSFTMELVE